MADTPRIFSVLEANALLPRIRAAFARQREFGAAIESTIARWRAEHGPDACPPSLHPGRGDGPAVERFKQELRGLIAQFREAWTQLESTGVVIKDAHEGRIDFYGEHHGQLVWLCWRVDEPEVAYWHPLDTGDAERRPLGGHLVASALN